MLFVDLNDNFSCQEFDRLLCNCSIKGCRENGMRKTSQLVCDVTLPATGVEKTDNLPIGITETLHVPRFMMVFTSFDAFILPLEKRVEQRDRHVCTGVPSAGGDVYHSRQAQRRAVVHNSASFLCMKNYHLNPQTTYV